MNAHTVNELEIWNEILGGDDEEMKPSAAKEILAWHFADETQELVDNLATRNNEGTITEAEYATLKNYVHVGRVLSLLHAKARLALKRAGDPAAEV